MPSYCLLIFKLIVIDSRLFKQAVATVSDHIEDRGIDEIYVDLSHRSEDSHDLAEQIRQASEPEATGLTCSVGITPNKLLSKIASGNEQTQWRLCADHGRCTHPHLAAGGRQDQWHRSQVCAETDADGHTAHCGTGCHFFSAEKLQEHFGLRYPQWLMAVAQGQDERPLSTVRTPKSISRETHV